MTLLDIDNLSTHYETDEGTVRAVDDVSLSLEAGETLGVVGESGSGKSTFARSINRILDDNAEIVEGSIEFDGVDLTTLSESELNDYRWQEISMIPQSAMNALDPVYTIEAQIVEVIRAHENTGADDARSRARDLFEIVGLDPNRVTDYPHQFSGGMRQRAIIALALALEPKLIIADEPTTALDVVIQSRIVDDLKDLQDELDFSMIVVTHDMSVVSELSDRIAVFYGGQLAELADTATIIKEAVHPYTLGLRNAFPTIETEEQDLVSIPGSPPKLTGSGDRCLFVDRCPFAVDECSETRPALEEYEAGHFVHCHRSDEATAIRRESSKTETWADGASDPASEEVRLDD